MADGSVPPEIPPPWRPDQPEEPRPSRAPDVPLVPWPESGAPASNALDALLQRRIVLVSGRLTSETATTAAAQVMFLDAEHDAGIELYLSSSEGDLDAALMLADTVGLTVSPVTVVCRARVGGPVLAVVAAARRRVAYPHATFWLHEPQLNLAGRSDDVLAEAGSVRRQLAALHAGLAGATGKPLEVIAADLQEGTMLTAEQAEAYGLIHEVVQRGHA